ncbi:MAG TPA: methyltransferase domain-containing protein [Bryobacteraceae bacterium]
MKSTRTSCLFPLLLACFPLLGAAQPVPLQNGRQAELANPQEAWWFYRPERVESEKPEELLDVLGIKNGDVVADIGAGPGFFSLRAAEHVGPRGKVFAVDVQQEMIDGLRRMIQKSGLENIVPILGSVEDPKLPENSVDEALIIIAYHEFSHPAEMMHHVYTAMKQDARMLIVEYKAEDPDSRVSPAHKMRATDILSEISSFGFRLDKAIDMIPTQHVFIFKKDNRLN